MSQAGGLIRILEVTWLDLLGRRLAAVAFCGAQGLAGRADTEFPEFEQIQSRGEGALLVAVVCGFAYII